jgi:hypothetical protein
MVISPPTVTVPFKAIVDVAPEEEPIDIAVVPDVEDVPI